MKNNSIAIIIVVAIIVGAGGFFAGMKYQQSQRPSFGGQFAGNFTGRGQNGGQPRGGANASRVMGDIISSGNNTVTVKLADGSSKIILLSSSTQINKAVSASTTDLTTGTTISVFGTTNSDGSVTASDIQINPGIRGQPGASPASQ